MQDTWVLDAARTTAETASTDPGKTTQPGSTLESTPSLQAALASAPGDNLHVVPSSVELKLADICK